MVGPSHRQVSTMLFLLAVAAPLVTPLEVSPLSPVKGGLSLGASLGWGVGGGGLPLLREGLAAVETGLPFDRRELHRVAKELG